MSLFRNKADTSKIINKLIERHVCLQKAAEASNAQIPQCPQKQSRRIFSIILVRIGEIL